MFSFFNLMKSYLFHIVHSSSPRSVWDICKPRWDVVWWVMERWHQTGHQWHWQHIPSEGHTSWKEISFVKFETRFPFIKVCLQTRQHPKNVLSHPDFSASSSLKLMTTHQLQNVIIRKRHPKNKNTSHLKLVFFEWLTLVPIRLCPILLLFVVFQISCFTNKEEPEQYFSYFVQTKHGTVNDFYACSSLPKPPEETGPFLGLHFYLLREKFRSLLTVSVCFRDWPLAMLIYCTMLSRCLKSMLVFIVVIVAVVESTPIFDSQRPNRLIAAANYDPNLLNQDQLDLRLRSHVLARRSFLPIANVSYDVTLRQFPHLSFVWANKTTGLRLL